VTIFSLIKIEGSFKKGYVLLLLLVSLSIVLYTLWDFLPIQQRVEQAFFGIQEYLNGNHKTSVGYRFEMWKAGWYGFLEKPILGWGFTNFDEVFTKYLELGFVKGRGELMWGHPHNDFIQILVELGALGFIIFMSVFIYPLVYFFKNALNGSKENTQVLYLSLIGIVLIEAILEFMLTNRGITIIYIFHLYILMIYILFSLINRINSNEVRRV
jgi:O-antigen ligase